MKTGPSQFVFVATRLIGLLTLAATIWWLHIFTGVHTNLLQDHARPGWDAVGFVYLIAPVLGILSLGCVIPGAALFFRTHDQRDFWSLCFAAGSFLALVTELILLFCF